MTKGQLPIGWIQKSGRCKKIGEGQQADHVLSTVYDWVEKAECPDVSKILLNGWEIKYL